EGRGALRGFVGLFVPDATLVHEDRAVGLGLVRFLVADARGIHEERSVALRLVGLLVADALLVHVHDLVVVALHHAVLAADAALDHPLNGAISGTRLERAHGGFRANGLFDRSLPGHASFAAGV